MRGYFSMTVDEKKALVRRLYEEVWNAGNFELFDEIYDPALIQHNPLPGQLQAGREELRVTLRQLREAFPDLHVEINLLLERGDEVAAVLNVSGTHRGRYIGVEPTNKPMSIAAIVIHRVAGGKIVETWSSRDEEGLMRQLGKAATT